MASPFSQAWEILKYFKNPHDEERSFGGVSMRDHPLFGQPGYEGTMRDQPTERDMLEMDDPRMAEDSVDAMEIPPLARDRYKQRAGMGGHEGPKYRPPNPFEGERGSIYREADNEVIEDYLRDMGMLGEVPDKPESAPDMVGDVGRPRTIPMSPRGSVRGQGAKQAFDKPKKPDWWRTLTGEE